MLLLFFLFFLLAVNVSRETFFIKQDEKLKDFFAVTGQASLIGLTVFFGGFIFCRYFEGGEIYFFDFERIWARGSVSNLLELCTALNLREGFQNGIMPIYPAVVHMLGKLMLGHFMDAAVYVSFFSGVLFIYEFYLFIKEVFPNVNPENTLSVFLFTIFSVFIFIPTQIPLALLFGVTALRAGHKKRFLASLLFTFLAGMTDLSAPILIIPIALLFFGKKTNMVYLLYGISVIVVTLAFSKASTGFRPLLFLFPLYPYCQAVLEKTGVVRIFIFINTILSGTLLMVFVKMWG